MCGEFFSSGNPACAYDKSCSTGFDVLNIEHPAAWRMHIALSHWRGCWTGLGVEVARSRSHVRKSWHSLSVWAAKGKLGCEGKEPFGRLCRMRLIWSDFVLACTHCYHPWADSQSRNSVCWEQGKHHSKSCPGSDFQCQPLCPVAPVWPQISAHTWWGFSPGACSVRVAVARETAGWNREWNNLIHKK